jgi:CTP synthase (UTP-ammonia lyase)
MDGALRAIRYAREHGVPFLGTCGGFQHALIEYARSALGLREAEHAESTPGAGVQLIAPLSCSLVGVSGPVRFAAGSRVRAIYGASEATETYHCNYGLSPRYAGRFAAGPLRITATDDAGEPRVVELEGHPFFVATLYQPERWALRGALHPLVAAFVAAAAERSAGQRRLRAASVAGG